MTYRVLGLFARPVVCLGLIMDIFFFYYSRLGKISVLDDTFQDELVRLNLRIKSLTASFPSCVSREEMESLNSNVRRQMELMRQNLDKLRSLAAKQKTAESKKMLLADTESHADELV